MRSSRTRNMVTVAGLLAAALGGLAASRALAGPDEEFRAMACSRFEWPDPHKDMQKCKEYIDGLMQMLHRNNFNAVILQMRGQCDTLYPSPNEPWSPILSDDGKAPAGWGDFDPMAYAIKAAHDNGLEFHAYLNAHVCWNSSLPPDYCPKDALPIPHIYWKHCDRSNPDTHDWLVCNSAGFPPGFVAEYVWVAPGVPSFQSYWREQIMHVVRKYDGSDPVRRPAIDGVHFDRIRTPGADYSHDPISEGRRSGEGNPDNLDFGDWTSDQITRTLCDLYAQINEYTTNTSPTHHRVKVSSAPLGLYRQERYPDYPDSYQYGRTKCYQDAQAWLAAGAHDFICPQVYWADAPYRTDTPHFSEVLPDWLRNNSDRHVYVFSNAASAALGDEIPKMRKKVEDIGLQNAAGVTVWSYGAYGPNCTWFSDPGGPFEQPARVPTMPWKDSPTDAIVLGTVTDGGSPILDAHITQTWSSYTALSSADGLYSFLKVPPGTHTLTFDKPGVGTATLDVTVVAGQVLRIPEVVLGNIIRDVQAGNLTDTAATVTWTTTIAADSQVQYGTTTDYESSTALDSTAVTAHSVNLTDLQPKTQYHYRVVSTADKTYYSGDHTFTTDGAPIISNVQVTNITTESATITWDTDTAADSQVSYGATSSYEHQTPLDSNHVLNHSVALSGLEPGLLYHFQVASGNGYGSDQSADLTFSTVGRPVISNVAAGAISSKTATITWDTDVVSDSQVEYGPTSDYGRSTNLDPSAVTSHSVALGGLDANTTYHYRVRSANGAGPSYSDEFTFGTNDSLPTPVISNVAAGSYGTSLNVSAITVTATVTWNTDTAADSQVEYGATTAYGATTTLDAAQVTSHSVTIAGLSRTTTYHYRVRSANDAGPSYSGDYCFITPIVIDNAETASVSSTGSWTTGSNSSVPKVGTNYLYAHGTGNATTSATFRWMPNIPAAGRYDVYVYYQKGSNRNASAPFTVVYDGGSVTTTENQYSTVSNQGGWFKIGSDLPFAAGTNGYAEVGNGSMDTQLVSADATMFVRLPDAQPRSITGWRSVRLHGTTSLGIALDASGGSTVEPRSGGIQRIDIDFDGPVTLGDSAKVQVSGVTTTDGVPGNPVTYTPSEVNLADADTMAIVFAPGLLPDATAYTITLAAGATVEPIVNASSCRVRALVGDVTGNGAVNLGDVLFTRLKEGQPLADMAGFDIDLSGAIDSGDVQGVKALVATPARSAQ